VAITPSEQFINLVEVYYNYEADIEYLSARDDSKIAAESRSPDSKGVIRFDASAFLRDFELVESFDFADSANDLAVMVPFYFKIGETYLTTTTSPVRINSNNFFAVAADPIFRIRGANMGEELGFAGATPGLQQGAFLTDFEKPRIFEGWPFSLSFMYVPNGLIDNLFASGEEYDINKTELNSSDIAISVSDLTEVIKVPVFPSGKQQNTDSILFAITGSSTFSFLTSYDPISGTFDPAISTSSGIATWFFEDLSIMNGNSISTSGNGLDGTEQTVEIVNLDPSVITAIDFVDDVISGRFDASNLVNCPIYRLSNNQITTFEGGNDRTVTELDLSGNGTLAAVNISKWTSLQGILNLSNCNLGTGAVQFPNNNQNSFSSFDLSNNSLGYINLATAFPNIADQNSAVIDLSDNGMNQSEVNAYIIDLNRMIGSGYTGRVIHINGSNAGPNLINPSVTAALAGLSGNGVTVNYTTGGGGS